MTTYRIDDELVTRAQIVARFPQINANTLDARLLRGYRTWAELGASKVQTKRKSKARFAGWQITKRSA